MLPDAAKGEGLRIADQSRGFIFKADLISVLSLPAIGTRAT